MREINYHDKEQQQKIRHIFSDMDICGCGSPAPYAIIHAMLARAAAEGSFYDPLDDIPGKATELIAKVMGSDSWGLLEHGCSIGGAWLTERGEALLHFFEAYGDDDDAWPEWWCSCDEGEEW